MEMLFSIAIHAVVFSFFGWIIWVTNPQHPDRLQRVRNTWGPKQ